MTMWDLIKCVIQIMIDKNVVTYIWRPFNPNLFTMLI